VRLRELSAAGVLLLMAVPATAGAQLIPPIDGGPIFCSSDSDCPNPYLACAPTMLSVCRDPDASSASVPAALLDAAACPDQSHETLDLCVVRYQLPCDSGASCGPAGFTCGGVQGTICSGGTCMSAMRCQSQYTLCASDSDCPAGWSCYAPSGGPATPPDASVVSAPKACYPPFSEFNGSASGSGSSGPATLVAAEGGSGDVDGGSGEASVQGSIFDPEPKDCTIGRGPGRQDTGGRGSSVMAACAAFAACVLRRSASRRRQR
jgi:hypothetical protein